MANLKGRQRLSSSSESEEEERALDFKRRRRTPSSSKDEESDAIDNRAPQPAKSVVNEVPSNRASRSQPSSPPPRKTYVPRKTMDFRQRPPDRRDRCVGWTNGIRFPFWTTSNVLTNNPTSVNVNIQRQPPSEPAPLAQTSPIIQPHPQPSFGSTCSVGATISSAGNPNSELLTDEATFLRRQCKPVLETVKTSGVPVGTASQGTVSKRIVNNPLEYFKNRMPVDPLKTKLETRQEYELSLALQKYFEKNHGTPEVSEVDSGTSSCASGETSTVEWDIQTEKIEMVESVQWIPPKESNALDLSVLTAWRKVGEKDTSLFCLTDALGVSNFISPNLRKQLNDLKDEVSNIDENELIGARLRSNAFETIRSSIFMNRASVKMANLDAALEFDLTTPKTLLDRNLVSPAELFYFADVCAGPGGFSEYVLWRKGWEAKGFGFTLKKCDCDFNLSDFIVGRPESFDVYYGANGDGNILTPANVASFIKYVMDNSDAQGVHLMMADGGFEVEDKHQQEVLSKSIYLAQILVAIGIVREGGTFVCKVFDIMTSFSVALIYLLYNCFGLISIHKPNTSRPGNAERYIICKWKKDLGHTKGVFKYLCDCHKMLWKYNKGSVWGTTAMDILELVPMNVLTEAGSEFYSYIRASNDFLATKQILALQKLKAFHANPALKEHRQEECRQYCIQSFGIPDLMRPKPISCTEDPSDRFPLLRQGYTPALFVLPEAELTISTMSGHIKSPYDWRCVVVGSATHSKYRGFFFSLGKSRVFRYDQFVWREAQFPVELSRDTLVYGEFVFEVSTSTFRQKPTFHIIDALFLGGKDVRNLHYTQRHEQCVKFAKAMNKPADPKLIPVRAKSLIRVEHVSEIFEKLTYHQILPASKDKPGASLLCPRDINDDFCDLIHPTGLLFLKITKDPWIMASSRSSGRKYWFETLTGQSSYTCPGSSIADFRDTVERRLLWVWNKDTRLSVVSSLVDNGETGDKVHAFHITSYVEALLAQVGATN